MHIAFIHAGNAFMPEIAAYQTFFHNIGLTTSRISPEQTDHSKADILWYFMGFGGKKRKGKRVIHEYTSCSVPPFAAVKDAIKKILVPPPDFRIFQNEYVRKKMSPADHVPYGFRDHGYAPVDISPVTPSYDFVYVGTVAAQRRLERVFRHFSHGRLQERSLLVLSNEYRQLQDKLGNPPNIHFRGPVAPDEVPFYIRQARYGLNIIPDRKPFNRQTSGKLLDYAAARIPIISTDYYWIRQFQQTAGGSFFYLNTSLSNFTWDNIRDFRYEDPDLSGWTWDHQIRRSGIVEWIYAGGTAPNA